MQLRDARTGTPEETNARVRSIQVVKSYFIHTGRNAWWSTWSSKYTSACMHTSLDSAQAECEQQRVQGTVFYIDELPTLAFVGNSVVLVVTEINCDGFFSRFDTARLATILSVLPTSSLTLDQIQRLFNPLHGCWKSGYPATNSAILSLTADPSALERLGDQAHLRSWASSSYGPTRYLRWTERPFEQDFAVVHVLAALFG